MRSLMFLKPDRFWKIWCPLVVIGRPSSESQSASVSQVSPHPPADGHDRASSFGRPPTVKLAG